MLYRITYPDGSAYTFTYNLYGEIDKIVYPTGGYERFVYGAVPGITAMNSPYASTNRGVKQRFVSPDGTAASEQPWDYDAVEVSADVLKTVTIAPDNTVTERFIHRSLLPGVKYFDFDDARSGMVFEERLYAPGAERGQKGALLRRKLTKWDYDYYIRSGIVFGGYRVSRKPRVTREVEVTLDPEGDQQSDVLTRTTRYTYDSDQNVTSRTEYGYVRVTRQSAQAAEGQISAVDSFADGARLRKSATTYLVNDPDPNIDQAKKDEYRARNLVALPTSTIVFGTTDSVVASQALTKYDEIADYPVVSCPGIAGWTDPQTYARGDATTSKVWVNTDNAWVETHVRFDQAGNVRESRDAHLETDATHGRVSEYTYTTAYQYTYLEGTKTPAPDPTGVSGSSAQLTSENTYDAKTGLIKTATDANGQTTRFYYINESGQMDPLNRLRKVENPDLGWTSYEYGNTPFSFYVRTRTAIDASRSTDFYQYFDGLGRPSRFYSYDGSAPDRTWVGVKSTYDNMGRQASASNPQFLTTLGDFTPANITTTEYDHLSRVRKVTTPDGAYVSTSYDACLTDSLNGARVTVTDQALKARNSVSDALGRLVLVTEAPGVAGYGYETSYKYDPLNRATRRTYSIEQGYSAPTGYVATPEVHYFYDGTGMPSENGAQLPAPLYSAGRLTAVKSSVLETAYTEFDAAGRVTRHRQISDPDTAAERSYKMEYAYDLAGDLASEKYPSGKVVETEYDGAGRVAGVRNNATGAYYAGGAASDAASRIRYAAHGTAEALRLGNGLWEQTSFNSRLQVEQTGLGVSATDSSRLRLTYGYGTASRNNGNVTSQRIEAGGLDLTQTYSYDEVHRLLSARESPTAGGDDAWRQAYTYADSSGHNPQFGNRRIDAANTTSDMLPQYNPQIDAGTNRIANNQGYAYDPAGDLLQDPSHSYSYDGENRLVAADGGWNGTSGASYYFDADGRRVRKVSASENTAFIYDTSGRLVAEYSNQARQDGRSYLTQDALGSTRVVTDAGGAVRSRRDYLPFGEEVDAGAGGRAQQAGYGLTDNVRQRFAGKERDDETGLDYFGARAYSATQGRFTYCDPTRLSNERVVNPQTWNLYVYVNNNPLALTDPNGQDGQGNAGGKVIDIFLVYTRRELRVKKCRIGRNLNESIRRTAMRSRCTGIKRARSKMSRPL
ncbi:MAG: RHS repeat domain-containing protein [Pyrinomonadaceae bacterium]